MDVARDTGIELRTGDAFALFADRLATVTDPPRVKLTLMHIAVARFNKHAVITCHFRGFPKVPVRLSLAWARVLRDGLDRVLGGGKVER